jgi:hypothetical protein
VSTLHPGGERMLCATWRLLQVLAVVGGVAVAVFCAGHLAFVP